MDTQLFFIIRSSYWFNIYTAIWICFGNFGHTMRIVSEYLIIFTLFMNQDYFDLYNYSEDCFMDNAQSGTNKTKNIKLTK
jgi:hypothetical protein